MSSPAAGFVFNDYRTETDKGWKPLKTVRDQLSGGAGVGVIFL